MDELRIHRMDRIIRISRMIINRLPRLPSQTVLYQQASCLSPEPLSKPPRLLQQQRLVL